MVLSTQGTWCSNDYVSTVRLVKYKIVCFHIIARSAIYICCGLYNNNISWLRIDLIPTSTFPLTTPSSSKEGVSFYIPDGNPPYNLISKSKLPS